MRVAVAVLLASAACLAAADARWTPGSLSPELRRLAAEARSGPPAPADDRWTVDAGGQQFDIRLPRGLTRDQRAEWLEQRARRLEEYASASDDDNRAPAQLRDILNRREFAGVGPPSAWELAKQKIQEWFRDQLLRIFAFAAQHPSGSRILFWTLISAALGAIAWILIRIWRRETIALRLEPAALVIGRMNRPEWLEAARRAAGSADWCEAVRCLYWAGIVALAETGVVPGDHARTPREYLRLTAGTACREPLAALTDRLERAWYAGLPANSGDYEECRKCLEALGCKVN